MFKDDELHNRVRQLESQRPSDVRRTDALQTRAEAAEARAEQQARLIFELNGQLEALRQDIARLRGQIEVLTNEVENGSKRQRDFYVDLDGRLRKLEAAAAPPPPPPTPSGPKPPTADEQKAYDSGLNLIKAGNYKAAVEAFSGFLKAHGASVLAPAAQYWIGNSLFALRDYKGAITAQLRVLELWPDDAKAPDAMLNIASSQVELKDARAARATLENLIKRYPQSEAAATARERLPRVR
ncbi:MAG: tol-pal system protein YbgF [Burkholderiales bacterium]